MSKKLKSPILQKYQKIYEKDPTSRVFAPLAESYRKLGMIEKAFEVLRQGIKYHPDYVMGYLGLASCYADEKEWMNVYSTLRPFVNRNRDNLRLQKLFGKACVEVHHEEEALETYKFLLFLNPKDKDAASYVEKLEKNYRLEPSESNFSSKDQFDVEQFESEDIVDDDLDDWETIHLERKTSGSTVTQGQTDKDDNWKMGTFRLNEEINDSKDVISNFDEQTMNELESDVLAEPPVVTHTLIDLYCAQGHIELAIEVLEKILELNPKDEKTLAKLSEVKQLMVENGDDVAVNVEEEKSLIEPSINGNDIDVSSNEGRDSEDEDHQRLLSEFEQKARKSERESKDKIMRNLESFLAAIEKKSKSYQSKNL